MFVHVFNSLTILWLVFCYAKIFVTLRQHVQALGQSGQSVPSGNLAELGQLARQRRTNRRNFNLALKLLLISSLFFMLVLSWMLNDKLKSTWTTFIERLAYVVNSSAAPWLFFVTSKQARRRMVALATSIFCCAQETGAINIIQPTGGGAGGGNNVGLNINW